MPEFSPEAQAVLDAYRSNHLSNNNLATALRAVADNCKCDDAYGYWIYRPNILAIAKELEAHCWDTMMGSKLQESSDW
ncbi:hypothetical protein [Thermus thermophilus]|jgi:hypothetical protein|uniref:hypothetical protein n=1 Tax=Thermus thermophilus TaxID=274 RepID=UPI000235CB46|nr:hypothetical protein CPVG_00032 [Cyanophage KBS-S-1A]NHK40022.1 hypothetical protein [Thermus thermophilus]